MPVRLVGKTTRRPLEQLLACPLVRLPVCTTVALDRISSVWTPPPCATSSHSSMASTGRSMDFDSGSRRYAPEPEQNHHDESQRWHMCSRATYPSRSSWHRRGARLQPGIFYNAGLQNFELTTNNSVNNFISFNFNSSLYSDYLLLSNSYTMKWVIWLERFFLSP